MYNKKSIFHSEITEGVVNDIVRWVRSQVPENHGITLGVSGGKDSTVALALCVKAVGADKVQAVLLPNGIQKDINDSEEICKFLNVKPTIINIGNVYKDICSVDIFDDKSKTNIAPRIRMIILYALAQTAGNRVCGTGNICERFVGWCTKWGDMACDFNPLGNLTVSQVVKIGELMGLPKHLVEKAPADGITGKTDEENLGFSYDDIEGFMDDFLNRRVQFRKSPKLESTIAKKNMESEHKRSEVPMYDLDWEEK